MNTKESIQSSCTIVIGVQKSLVLQVQLNSRKTFDHRKFQVCSITLHMDIYSHDLHINNKPRISLGKLC